MEEIVHAFGIDWRLIVIQMFNFALLLAALWYFLYRPVLRMLAKRQELVTKGVEDARHAGEALARSDAEAESRVSRADTEAEHIVSNAREHATAEKIRLLKEAEARALEVVHDAEARAEETHARAWRESEKEIARLAMLAAEKAMKKYD